MFDREPAPEEPACIGDADDPWWCISEDAALREELDAERLWLLGVGDASQVAAAARALGAWLEPGGGLALGGASGLEHRWLVDGFPIDSLATGGPETRIPLA